MSTGKLCIAADIAAEAGVSVSVVYRAARRKEIPCSFSQAHGGKIRRLWTPEDYDKAVEILRAKAVPKSEVEVETLPALMQFELEETRAELTALRTDVVGTLAIVLRHMEGGLNAIASLTAEVRELRKDLAAIWDMEKSK